MSTCWNAIAWREKFQAASASHDYHALHALRTDVFRNTVEVVRSRGYDLPGRRVELDAQGEYESLHRGTTFHASTDALVVPAKRRNAFTMQVEVRRADCLDAARDISLGGTVPAVLNMASRRNPGGGAHTGAGAQEENLFRRSNLFWSLYQFVRYAHEYGVPENPDGLRYPIPRESGGIYSPGASIFRSSEATGYAFLEAPFQASFLTVPAISGPDLEERDGQLWLTAPMAAATVRKIRAIFRIAAHHGHEDLVLSAFGCGAFHNPPQHMAELFANVLREPEFAGVFRQIVFAIRGHHNSYGRTNPEGNLVPFQREFASRSS